MALCRYRNRPSDLQAACFGFPATSQPASAGPFQDCVVDKVEEFESELTLPSTSAAERLLAPKFLIHFIGDLHQLLHASANEDQGGNCIGLSPSPDGRDSNLHAYWDTGIVQTLGGSAEQIAATLDGQITPANLANWERGNPKTRAMESFRLSFRMSTPSRPSRPARREGLSRCLTPIRLRRRVTQRSNWSGPGCACQHSSTVRLAADHTAFYTPNPRGGEVEIIKPCTEEESARADAAVIAIAEALDRLAARRDYDDAVKVKVRGEQSNPRATELGA